MAIPKPTTEKAQGDHEKDVRDMPRNEAPRTLPLGGADPDPRAGETAAQDRVPSADDITLEATLLQRSTEPAGVEGWREAGRRFQPGIEEERTPVRGPSASGSTGRAVTERETVADDAADADGTDRNPAVTRDDDPDA
ncbi:MAG: hypothetical protein ABIT71_10645 [Vicinamibacteraceae bacterium]